MQLLESRFMRATGVMLRKLWPLPTALWFGLLLAGYLGVFAQDYGGSYNLIVLLFGILQLPALIFGVRESGSFARYRPLVLLLVALGAFVFLSFLWILSRIH